MKIAKNLIFSNLLLALGAAFSAWWPVENGWEVPALIGLATWLRYSITAFTVAPDAVPEKFQFVYKHRKMLQLGVIATAVCLLPLLATLSVAQFALLAHLGVLSLWYLFPLPFGIARPLRQIPYLKIFLIVHIWACSTYLLPALPALPPFWPVAFAERLCFFFGLALMFDIQDLADDRARGMATIPIKIGQRRTKMLSVALLFLASLLAFFAYTHTVWLAMCAVNLLSAVFCWNASPQRPALYFLGIIDGLLLLQAVAVLLTKITAP